MTEKDLTDLGFIKQVQDACCDPQVYTFYLQVGSSIPFITPASDTIVNDSWVVENYAIDFKTLVKSDLVAMITLLENNPIYPPT
jgi:hypothetical protein